MKSSSMVDSIDIVDDVDSVDSVFGYYTSKDATVDQGWQEMLVIGDKAGRYTANAKAIERRKQEMLAIDDSIACFMFSYDTEFQAEDPNAYWLLNRMMLMVQLVETADDGWAWMLAMNKCIEEYNNRLVHKICSVDAACDAISELNDKYEGGNQPEINTATYVGSILMHYKATYVYYRLIESIDDHNKDSDWDDRLKALYYREFKEWFDLNNAANGIMCFYSYAPARYSSVSVDINCTFEEWSKERLAELKLERDIYCSTNDLQPFESNAEDISSNEFNMLLDDFKSRVNTTGVEDVSESEDSERDDDEGDFYVKTAKMLRYYETALTNWREVREQITQMLPKEKQKSYREITKQIHTRLYVELKDLTHFRC